GDRRDRCPQRARSREGGEMELALLRFDTRDMVPVVPRLRSVHEGGVLQGRRFDTAAAGGLEAGQRALPPRGRDGGRRGAACQVGEAGREAARRGDVGQMKKATAKDKTVDAAKAIDERIAALGDWRGDTLKR